MHALRWDSKRVLTAGSKMRLRIQARDQFFNDLVVGGDKFRLLLEAEPSSNRVMTNQKVELYGEVRREHMTRARWQMCRADWGAERTYEIAGVRQVLSRTLWSQDWCEQAKQGCEIRTRRAERCLRDLPLGRCSGSLTATAVSRYGR